MKLLKYSNTLLEKNKNVFYKCINKKGINKVHYDMEDYFCKMTLLIFK